MKTKRVLAILCSVVMVWSVTVFADCGTTKQQYIQKQVDIRNEILTFTTMTQEHDIGYRCFPEMFISIKENHAGVLHDGDIIYFKTATGEYDNKYLKALGIDITAKGVTAKEIKLPEGNEDCFAVSISRGSKNSLAEIDIKFSSEFHGVTYKDEYMPTFSLYLDADNTKENNLFSGEQDILLNGQFLIVTGGDVEIERQQHKKHQKFKNGLPNMLFSTESNTMTLGTEKIILKHNVYINEKGVAMLSLEDFESIMNQLNDIGASAEHIFYHDDDNYEKDWYDITAGRIYCSIYCEENRINFDYDKGYNKPTIENVLEEKNGVFYIPLRVIAKILDMENHINWDNHTKAITISAQ